MTYIIAEAGTSHAHPDPHRRYLLAVKHICLAAEAGADAVKFQMFVSDFDEPLFCPLPGDDKRWARWRNTVLSLEEWRQLKGVAFTAKIDLLFSAFQHEAVDWCRQLTPRYYKVASRAAESFPYHSVPGPYIVSTGMFTPRRNGREMYFLSCVPQYPVALEHARWNGSTDGLSDHSGTVWPGIDSLSRGARFLEVHFSDALGGNDPNLTPAQLKLLCDARDGFARMAA